jgi:hypothetical protein
MQEDIGDAFLVAKKCTTPRFHSNNHQANKDFMRLGQKYKDAVANIILLPVKSNA